MCSQYSVKFKRNSIRPDSHNFVFWTYETSDTDMIHVYWHTYERNSGWFEVNITHAFQYFPSFLQCFTWAVRRPVILKINTLKKYI